MICLVDASTVVDLLVRRDVGERVRRRLTDDADTVLVTVARLDAEVLSALARLHRAGDLTAGEADELLRRLATLDVRRIPITGALLDAAWRLRDDIAARDAQSVAAARDLGCVLLTTDERLARAVPDLAIGHAEVPRATSTRVGSFAAPTRRPRAWWSPGLAVGVRDGQADPSDSREGQAGFVGVACSHRCHANTNAVITVLVRAVPAGQVRQGPAAGPAVAACQAFQPSGGALEQEPCSRPRPRARALPRPRARQAA